MEAHEHRVQNPVCFEMKLNLKIIFIFILLVPLYDSKVTYCIIYGGDAFIWYMAFGKHVSRSYNLVI
jgi:hypothetical protein